MRSKNIINIFVYIIIALVVLSIIMLSIKMLSIKKDDTITVYSTRTEHLISPLFQAFEDKTGLKVKYLTGKDGALIERMRLEGKNTKADIFMTVDAGNLWYAGELGLLQSVTTNTLKENIPSNLIDPNNLWNALSLRARTIVYSTTRVNPKELSTYEDLASDKWQGRLCLRSSKNIYNKSLVASMIHHKGRQETKDIVSKWVDNLAATPYDKDSQVMQAIIAGQCDVGLVNTYYLATLKDENPDVAIDLFWANQKTTGVHINISGAGITKYAPNKKAAIKLLEFLSSKEAQEIYMQLNNEYPVNKNLQATKLIKKWGIFKQDDINVYILGQKQAQAVSLMQEVGYK